ncbi:hypothetical protein CIPAW_07G069000 [Carya illinoinensis]|uniref:Uncharacterized protein n=1 Tax=Carya illinoinensis TaxID=32201 RepID=A0A8T1PZQ9_CARIL|nr:hypothetical protein CIPAW_07G069000 [Carya illinoinensis]
MLRHPCCGAFWKFLPFCVKYQSWACIDENGSFCWAVWEVLGSMLGIILGVDVNLKQGILVGILMVVTMCIDVRGLMQVGGEVHILLAYHYLLLYILHLLT